MANSGGCEQSFWGLNGWMPCPPSPPLLYHMSHIQRRWIDENEPRKTWKHVSMEQKVLFLFCNSRFHWDWWCSTNGCFYSAVLGSFAWVTNARRPNIAWKRYRGIEHWWLLIACTVLLEETHHLFVIWHGSRRLEIPEFSSLRNNVGPQDFHDLARHFTTLRVRICSSSARLFTFSGCISPV